MDSNIVEIKDGGHTQSLSENTTPSVVSEPKQKLEGIVRKKRRRGKSKRKIMKPFVKMPWQERRKNEKSKRNNRFRKIVLAKTHAPFNNNQFLMEIHKPEPENSFPLFQAPSARTRDSSFSVDSEENYFYSLPEDEEEYLTKEFSSVYEDAQTERLSNMSKNELIEEFLLLESKYDTLVKRTERLKPKSSDEKEVNMTEKDSSVAYDKNSMAADNYITGTSNASALGEPTIDDMLQKIKEQEQQILELQEANEKLQLENENLRQKCDDSSSEDSESDSSSTSMSTSSSSSGRSTPVIANGEVNIVNHDSGNGLVNGVVDDEELTYPVVNGFHDAVLSSPNDDSLNPTQNGVEN